jgi:hypothetical protein
MGRRAAAWLLLIASAAYAVSAAAQNGAVSRSNGSSANGRAADPMAGKNGSNGAPAYEDQLIDGGQLEPDVWIGETAARNADGLPRGLRLDGIYSHLTRNGRTESNAGVGVGAFLATPLYGAWSFDGVFGNRDESSVATLWQRDVPFDNGWLATNGAGNLNSPSIDLARFQPRWFLPTSPLLGASTEWRNPQGTQLIAGVGEPGVYTGIYVPGFRRLGGTMTTAGGQWSLSRNWSAGFQYFGAREVTNPLQPEDNAQQFSSRSWFGSAAWQDRTQRYQVNAIASDNSFTGNEQGAWADGYVQDGRFGHGFGAFYMGNGLAWGNQPIGNGVGGAYYRVNYGSRQWLWDANIDYAAPLQDTDFAPSTFVSGSARHQIWQNLGVGAGANARLSDSDAWSAFGYVENTLPALVSRTQLSVAQSSPKYETTLTANQTWNMPAGTRLNTTFLVGRYTDRVVSSNLYGFAVFGGGDIARDLSIDVNAQWTQSTGEAQPTTLNGNLALTWRFLPDLQLIGTVYRSQARSQLPLQVVSPIDNLAIQTEERINDRGAFLILRYETRAGSMAPPLGGSVGGGAGRISGVVFLDVNEDARFAAGEQGAANVTVIIDGRYSVRTDGQGRFEFPSVASGRHVITVLPDNIPLPWMLVNEGRIEIEVPVRETVIVDIAAQRPR